ncbi:extracellular solute-binding protein [Nonomuraea sp. NPDC059023]|uniref:extracellular solute-binding protein n=1 Tax=unclassified Nonomuraea TaxID=2593643 RepID=UPI0036AB97B3
MRATPLYRELKAKLREEIENGVYGLDGRLPTEHELCERFELSRTPVTRALAELADEGVIIRHRRRGTFVNPGFAPPVRQRRTGTDPKPTLRILRADGTWVGAMRAAAGDAITLEVIRPPLRELHQTFLSAIAAGEGPDLAVLDSVWIAEFAGSGFLTPLNELDPEWVEGEHDADFLPTFAKAYRSGDAVVAVQGPSDVAGLWYRRDALRRAEMNAPATWSDLHELGRRLAAVRPPGRHVMAMPGGRRAAETTTYALTAFLASNGAPVLTEEGVVLDSPAAVETMRFLRRLIDDGILLPEVIGYGSDDAVQLLAEGRADLFVGASDLAGWAGDSIDHIGEEFGFAPMPRGPHGRAAVLCGGMAYAVPRQARHPHLAMRLLRAALAREELVRGCLETGQLPPRMSAMAEIATASQFHAETGRRLEHAVMRPSSPVYALVSARLQAMCEDVLSRRRTPEEAVARAADMISAITGLDIA